MTRPYGGTMWVAPVGTKPSDKGWRLLGQVSPDTLSFGYDGALPRHDGALPKRMSTSFTFDTKSWSPEVIRLYYGTDVYNNRGGARKEEKHMAVREFKGVDGGRLRIARDAAKKSGGVFLDLQDKSATYGWNWFEKADVPLIAHALFEQSGWPKARSDNFGSLYVKVGEGSEGLHVVPTNQCEADTILARAINALAAYNGWVEGEADRKAKAEEAAEEEARRKHEHDELRTSPIAMEALKLYNAYFSGNSGTPYASWDATNHGKGTSDESVRHWIRQAEAARAANPVPKVGDRVRVSQEGIDEAGANFARGPIDGVVVEGIDSDGDVCVRALASCGKRQTEQYVKPEFLTILETAEEAERKAEIARTTEIKKIQTAVGLSWRSAEYAYNSGLRATK